MSLETEERGEEPEGQRVPRSGRERVVVVAPGRGTYNRAELGYVDRWHGGKTEFLARLDELRARDRRQTITALDRADRYSAAVHGPGGNAAALIYAAALGDFQDIDTNRFDVVAVTGNSMGWYLALAAAGVTNFDDGGFMLTDFMAHLMDERGVGGQLLYPLMDDNWRDVGRQQADVDALFEQLPADELYVSIRLGGSVVLAGTDQALAEASRLLPAIGEFFPQRLPRHAAFHSPLQGEVSKQALTSLPAELFSTAELPLIDGRGEIWQPGAGARELRDYTLRTQVLETYDFTRAIEVAVKEFAPDRLIVLGPGLSMGAPVLQTLCRLGWLGLDSKQAWQDRQTQAPYVLSMGIEAQRRIASR